MAALMKEAVEMGGIGVNLPITHSVKVRAQVQHFPFALSLEIGARSIL